MIFVDTNVFMYAVGRAHPLREPAVAFVDQAIREQRPLVTSVEVLQELLHAYVRSTRLAELDAAWTTATSLCTVWPLDVDDLHHAQDLIGRHPALDARDLLHLACCQRRGVTEVKTYDRALAAAFA